MILDSRFVGTASVGLVKAEVERIFGFQSDIKIEEIVHAKNVTDNTEKFFIHVPNAGNFVFILSNPMNRLHVLMAVEHTEYIRKNFTAQVGDYVIHHHSQGSINDQTYAIWPYLESIPNQGLLRRVIRFRLKSRVFQWLFDLNKQSLHVGDTDHKKQAIANLERLLQEHGLLKKFGVYIERAIQTLVDGRLKDYRVFSHNDLWPGNIFLCRPLASIRPGLKFVVIDWGGASQSGHPIFDLATLTATLTPNQQKITSEIHRYQLLLNCEREDLMSYYILGLAQILQNLGGMPLESFNSMSERYTTQFVKILRL